MGGRGASSGKGGGGNALQKHFDKENARIEKFLDGKPGDSIVMENGQILEHDSLKGMINTTLKEFKENGYIPEDFMVSILYKDGSTKIYGAGDDADKMKLSNIHGVIFDNPMTSAYAGKGVKIENYKEKYPDDYPDSKGYEDDWRIDFI